MPTAQNTILMIALAAIHISPCPSSLIPMPWPVSTFKIAMPCRIQPRHLWQPDTTIRAIYLKPRVAPLFGVLEQLGNPPRFCQAL
jgi:hypothetical protein